MKKNENSLGEMKKTTPGRPPARPARPVFTRRRLEALYNSGSTRTRILRASGPEACLFEILQLQRPKSSRHVKPFTRVTRAHSDQAEMKKKPK